MAFLMVFWFLKERKRKGNRLAFLKAVQPNFENNIQFTIVVEYFNVRTNQSLV